MSVDAPFPILPAPLQRSADDVDLDASRGNSAADFDSFLTLLTAQLRNQDPLQPLESTEFIAQLASFSSVEQLITVNDQIEALASQSLSGDIAGLSTWIGKDVSVTDGSFRATGETVRFLVPPVAEGATIQATVSDAFGSELRRLDVTASSGNLGSWDGKDALGVPIFGRDLKLELSVMENGSPTGNAPAEVLRRVGGLRGTEAGLVLDLEDGGQVAPDKVSRVSDALVNGDPN